MTRSSQPALRRRPCERALAQQPARGAQEAGWPQDQRDGGRIAALVAAPGRPGRDRLDPGPRPRHPVWLMRFPGHWFRSGRALAAVLLLSARIAGEVADARHHLSEHGCASDSGGRDDNCTCANLHAVSFADPVPVASAPLEHAGDFTPLAAVRAPRTRAATHASPRAPPRD